MATGSTELDFVRIYRMDIIHLWTGYTTTLQVTFYIQHNVPRTLTYEARLTDEDTASSRPDRSAATSYSLAPCPSNRSPAIRFLQRMHSRTYARDAKSSLCNLLMSLSKKIEASGYSPRMSTVDCGYVQRTAGKGVQ